MQVEPPGAGDALRSLRLADASGTSLWWRSYVSSLLLAAACQLLHAAHNLLALTMGTSVLSPCCLQGRNRRCMTLDLRKEEGRRICKRLAARSDVLIENFRPGVMEGWGLGPRVQPLPSQLMCSMLASMMAASQLQPGSDGAARGVTAALLFSAREY